MSRPKIKLTLVERKGDHGCHRGHRVGDSFDFDTEGPALSDGYACGVSVC